MQSLTKAWNRDSIRSRSSGAVRRRPVRQEGNVRRLVDASADDSSDDEQATWNGNSTQQLWKKDTFYDASRTMFYVALLGFYSDTVSTVMENSFRNGVCLFFFHSSFRFSLASNIQ